MKALLTLLLGLFTISNVLTWFFGGDIDCDDGGLEDVCQIGWLDV